LFIVVFCVLAAVSPLSCHASHLGCCWDNITKVTSGCPGMINQNRKLNNLWILLFTHKIPEIK